MTPSSKISLLGSIGTTGSRLAVLTTASICLALSLIPQTGFCAEPPAPIQADIHYGDNPRQILDVCAPASGSSRPIPALIMIHGGAWQFGDKKDWDDICVMAAAKGLVGIAIDYRLADGTTVNAWPAQLVDVQLAVRWVRSHATQYNIDDHHICSFGDSAGGHLTVFLAALDDIYPGDYSDQLSDFSPKVNCAVDWFGPVDLTGALAKTPNMRRLLVEKAQSDDAEIERAASPLFRVGPKTAPILIVHGVDDSNVNINQSQALQRALTAAGVPNQLWVYRGGHEFSGAKDQVRIYVDAALNFAKEPVIFMQENHPPILPP